MAKLTKARMQAMQEISDAGHASPYQLGVPSQVFGALLRSGYIEQVRLLVTWDKFSMFRITPAGRQALSGAKE